MSENISLSLDFANTAEWHAGPDPEEHLTSYAKAADWARQHEILSDAQVNTLLADARADPSAEVDALHHVIALREAVYRVFSAVAHQRAPAPADLEVLDGEAREAATHLRLGVAPAEVGDSAHAGGTPRFDWTWFGLEDDLTGFLWPVAKTAVELLTSKQLSQLRQCAGDPCGWLFLDLSKNGSRRWCDMADCGNRAKARRYRERKRGAAAVSGATSGPAAASGTAVRVAAAAVVPATAAAAGSASAGDS